MTTVFSCCRRAGRSWGCRCRSCSWSCSAACRWDWSSGCTATRGDDEATREKATDAVCERIDTLTRAHTIKQLLSPDRMRLLKRLTDKHQVAIMGFASDTHDVKPEAINELLHNEQVVKIAPK